jgi:uncharacterized protein (TIGR04255 family)
MPLKLPPVDDTALANPPLEVVVAQVRYEQSLAVSDSATVRKIHEQLGGRSGPYPRAESQNTVSAKFELGPAGLRSNVQSVPSRGYRFKSSDGSWIVSVMPEFTSLETTAYTTWSGDFEKRLVDLLRAINEHVQPSTEERLGLRYVNRLTDESRQEPGDWIGAVSDKLLGPVADPDWADATRAYHQQLDLDVGDDIGCTVRSGFIPKDGEGVDGYLLDFDVYRSYPGSFDVTRICEAAKTFNRTALALFQWSLTPEYLSALREG